MSGHGRGLSLACTVSRTPSTADAEATKQPVAVKAAPALFTASATPQTVKAIAPSTGADPAPAEARLPGFRHLLAGQRFTPFMLDGKPVDVPGDANQRMRDLMGKLAVVMQHDFAFGDPLPGASDPMDNPLVSSGYTYLLQLVGHDLVHSTLSLGVVGDGGSRVMNSRRSGLRLDTIYGDGPDVSRCAYTHGADETNGSKDGPRTLLRLGRIKNNANQVLPSCPMRDIARAGVANTNGPAVQANALTEAMVADPRNDDHAILSQLTALFHLLHNGLLARLNSQNHPSVIHSHSIVEADYDRFFAVRAAVTLIYRSIVRHDLLSKILREEVYRHYCVTGCARLEPWDGSIPLEFSHAVFRFGHAMIRHGYKIGGPHPGFLGTTKNLLQSSSRSADIMPISPQWVVEWSRFFCVGGRERNFSRRISTHYEPPLFSDMFGPVDETTGTGLAYRDLLSGAHAGLWSVPALMTRIRSTPGFDTLLPHGFDVWKPRLEAWLSGLPVGDLKKSDIDILSSDPPLLFFILFEAAQEPAQKGAHLGSLGSIIVAEVLFGALEAGMLPFEQGSNLPRSLAELGKLALKHEKAFDFVDDIRSMPELIAFMADELDIEDESAPFI